MLASSLGAYLFESAISRHSAQLGKLQLGVFGWDWVRVDSLWLCAALWDIAFWFRGSKIVMDSLKPSCEGKLHTR